MIENLPLVNALLNSTSAILLVAGHRAIRLGNRNAHKKLMIATFCVAVLFMISYLTYHISHGTTRFPGEGWVRTVYLAILGTHTICAAAIVPMAIITLRRGLKNSIERHRAIARWTYPIWLYVSVTGVIVYLMLYRL